MIISWKELLGSCLENEWKIFQLTTELPREQFMRATGQKRQQKKRTEGEFAKGLVKK